MNCCGGNHDHDQHNQSTNNLGSHQPTNGFKNVMWLVVIGIMLFGIWQLLPGIQIKAASIVPFLGILICPLMMGFMMLLGHNHGKNSEHKQNNS